MAENIWTTWDNRKIPIQLMETKHIRHALKTIERIIAKRYKLKTHDPTIISLAKQHYPEYQALRDEFARRENKAVKSSLAQQLEQVRVHKQ